MNLQKHIKSYNCKYMDSPSESADAKESRDGNGEGEKIRGLLKWPWNVHEKNRVAFQLKIIGFISYGVLMVQPKYPNQSRV